ncbi:uncharacterized protein N7484_009030 [Penicillium longicatenatum]|uniref:uncharacterized protein n=1 Tax=Penicillium longicatenatum TaxID=1561947 RepID=UPI0025498F79|nr:uncharacterized protein N7484_009030 [Penicillium longicatenatum]KAJ5635717.1 hypothetical protein N7484_009030 [Penicillium longicatenatum]
MIASNPLNLDLESLHVPSNIEHAVFSLLATYLPETSSITPNQAAEQVNDLLLSHRPGPKEERQSTASFLFEFWELMFCIAPQLDYQHEPMQRFIALVEALKNLPETIVIQDGGIYDGQPVWRDGLYFGPTLHERWNRIPESTPPEDLYAFRWRNMNGLLAHFTNHNLCTNDFRALACITNALEEFRRKKPKTPINHRVPAAAIWFVLCSSMIYLACQRQECADRKLSGELWKGEPQQGYSIARWNFWRKRFGELECHSDATEETKEACRAAIEEMDRYAGGVE